jgi:hypothetical protein
MKRLHLIGLVLGTAVLLGGFLPAMATKPSRARHASAFTGACREPGEYRNCKPVRIPSPDGKSVIEVEYRQEGKWRTPVLRVSTAGGPVRETAPPWGFQDIDLQWSPDSRAFFVNGGNGGAYWGFFVYAFRLDDPKLDPIDITRQARSDMLKTFPPCRSRGVDRETCKYVENDPQYPNMSGIDWTADSSAVVVMAEVPCSGGFGGIMCQVIGYELAIPSGRILRRMAALQLKARWQKSIAFQLEIPEAPEYQAGK